jgi:hypothetical protein
VTAATRRLSVVLGSTVFVLVGTLAQLPRQSGAYMWRTVWAEDGTRFYADALARPWRTNVLESYAGYAHVVPRTLASIGVQLPTAWYSVYVTLTASLFASLLSLFVYFASAPLLESRVRQAILALAVLLWPVMPFEISGSITNIQWAMPMACFLAVLLPVQRPAAVGVRLPIVVLAALSSPICVLFLPIAAWSVYVSWRTKAPPLRFTVPVVYAIAAVLQLLVFATAPQAGGTRAPLDEFVPDIARLYSTKVPTEFLFGVRAMESLWDALGYWIAVIGVVAVGAAVGWRLRSSSTTSRWFIVSCVVGGGALFAVSVWQRSNTIAAMLVEAGEPYNFAAMRYQIFPALLILLALLVRPDLEPKVFREPVAVVTRPWHEELRRQRWVVAVALVWLAVAFVPSYRLDTARSGGPDWITAVDGAEVACRTLPPSAAVELPISPQPIWNVAVPCWGLRP